MARASPSLKPPASACLARHDRQNRQKVSVFPNIPIRRLKTSVGGVAIFALHTAAPSSMLIPVISGKGFAAHAHGVIKPLLKAHITAVKIRTKPGGCFKIGGAGHNAKHAGKPRHAFCICPMGPLASLGNLSKHSGGAELVNWEPVKPGPAGFAVPPVLIQGLQLGPGAAFLRSKPHAIYNLPLKFRVLQQVTPDKGFDRAGVSSRSCIADRPGSGISPAPQPYSTDFSLPRHKRRGAVWWPRCGRGCLTSPLHAGSHGR